MKRRDKAGGKAVKARRHKTLTHRSALKAVRIRSSSSAGLDKKLALLTRERDELLEQQAATAEVLKTISRSHFDPSAVLETLIATTSRLCDADIGSIRFEDGDRYRLAATYGCKAEWRKHFAGYSGKPDKTSVFGQTIIAGRTVHIPDVLRNSDYARPQAQKLMKLRAALGVPLVCDGRVFGVMNLFRTTPRPFTAKQIALAQNFSAQAVIAIENTRLFNELRQRTDDLAESLQQQTATAEILSVINNSLDDTQPVFDAIVQSAVTLFPDALISIALRDGDMIRGAAAVAVSDPTRLEAWRRTFPYPCTRDYMHGRAILDRRIVDIPDVERAPPELAVGARNFLTSGYRAITIMPMIRGDAAIGAISVIRVAPGPLTGKQIAALKSFAAQAVIAIENTRLLTELRERTDDLTESLEQQTATSEILQVISNSVNDTQPVFDAIVQSGLKLFPGALVSVALRHGDTINAAAVAAPDPARVEAWRRTLSRTPLARNYMHGAALLDRRMVDIPDVADAPAEFAAGGQNFLTSGNRAITIMPMMRGDEAIGLLSVVRLMAGPLSDKQLAVLRTFASQAVIAIENTRLLNELRQRTDDLTESLEQQTATADVLSVMSRSKFDLQPILQSVVDTAVRLCRAEQGTISRLDGGLYRFAAGYSLSLKYYELERATPIAPGLGTVVGRAAINRRVARIDDAMIDPLYEKKEDAAIAGIHSMIGVPLMRDGEPIGVIALARRRVEPFSDREIELVTIFADQAVIAIENVRLFDEVQARTEELSGSLEELRNAQDRLVQTEKLASLGQLTAGIAHEIKNPLNFVNNFSSLSVELIDELREALGDAELDDKLRGAINELADMLQGNLDKVVQHGKRADSIVKNMLLHSRQDSGEHRPVDLNTLVEESLNLAYHGARAEKQGFNITLEKSFDPTAGEVDLFPQEITRVLLNLISNGFYAATKRKAHGGSYEPTLAAATKNLGDSVEIRIRDNGIGIPPEVKEKMFNPFFTTKPVGEGTGLGLSLSYDIIVKQHSGSIEVDTQPGAFTEFRIVLPRGVATIAESGEHD